MQNLVQIENQTIQDKIYTIRGVQVMIDRDLALLYGVEIKSFKSSCKKKFREISK